MPQKRNNESRGIIPGQCWSIVLPSSAQKTVTIINGDVEAVLSLDEYGAKKTWLLTGWKKNNKPGARGEVSTQSSATQAAPTFSRDDLVAGLSNENISRIFSNFSTSKTVNSKNDAVSGETKSPEWLQSGGLQLPTEGTVRGSTQNVLHDTDVVNQPKEWRNPSFAF